MALRRALAVVVACVAGVVALGLLLGGGGEPLADDRVLRFTLEHRSGFVEDVSRLLGGLGVFPVLMPAALLAAWWMRRRTGTALAASVPVALWVSAVTVPVLKNLYDRPRPPESLRLGESTSAAFPSGHAAYAAALAVAACLAWAVGTGRVAPRAAWVATGLVATMGASRVVLRVHWVTDVVAGWMLGAAAAIAVHLVASAVAARPEGGQRPERARTGTPRR